MRPEDLSNLDVLDENTIVQALRGRFHKDKYYVSHVTASGIIPHTLNSLLLY